MEVGLVLTVEKSQMKVIAHITHAGLSASEQKELAFALREAVKKSLRENDDAFVAIDVMLHDRQLQEIDLFAAEISVVILAPIRDDLVRTKDQKAHTIVEAIKAWGIDSCLFERVGFNHSSIEVALCLLPMGFAQVKGERATPSA